MIETLTIGKPLKVGMNYPDYRKWDVVKFANDGSQSLIIRVSSPPAPHLGHYTTYTLVKRKTFKKQWRQWLWFKILKIRVAIGDLYKK
jgi:hypothetical protein